VDRPPAGRAQCYRWYRSIARRRVVRPERRSRGLHQPLCRQGSVDPLRRAPLCYCFTPVGTSGTSTRSTSVPEGNAVSRLVGPWVAHRFRIWDRVRLGPRRSLHRGLAARPRPDHKHYRRPSMVVYPPVDRNTSRQRRSPPTQPASGPPATPAQPISRGVALVRWGPTRHPRRQPPGVAAARSRHGTGGEAPPLDRGFNDRFTIGSRWALRGAIADAGL
jgi:hypothetical protein